MIFYLDWSFLKYVDLIRKPFPSAVVYVPLKKSFEGFICFYVIMQQSVVQCNSMCSLVHRVVFKVIYLSRKFMECWLCFCLVSKFPLHLQAVGVGSFSGTTAAASAAAIRWIMNFKSSTFVYSNTVLKHIR